MASAHYHLSVKSIGRGTRSGGASNATGAAAYRSGTVIAMAAYRSGQELTERESGQVHDFTHKGGVLETHILAPPGAPSWVQDRSKLWNAAEQRDRRANARLATEIEVALPKELSAEQRRELVLGFAQGLVDKHQVVADVAIHQGKHRDNIHAHIMVSHREIGADGFGDLSNRHAVEKDDRVVNVVGIAGQPSDVKGLRLVWEVHVNRAYEQAGLEQRVDRRSYKARGIDREPQRYVGPRQANPERARNREWRISHNALVALRNTQRLERARRTLQQPALSRGPSLSGPPGGQQPDLAVRILARRLANETPEQRARRVERAAEQALRREKDRERGGWER